jgi:glycosyltransferase involved in cell wall biosynthesis
MSIVSPQVSVIVPTRNSEVTLARCLRSVLAQTEPVELIVVDNDSEDGTATVAERMGVRVIRAGPERSAQRNRGAEGSKGAFLFFVDSDMVLEPELVERCLSAIASAEPSAVVIPEVSYGRGFFASCRALEKRCYWGDPDIEGARFLDRRSFERVGGYDETIYAGEDWDLHERLRLSGARILRVDSAIVHLEGRVRLRSAFTKKLYYGRSIGRYLRKHPSLAFRQLWPLRAAFIKNWRTLATHPVLTSGLVVLKTVELTGLLLGSVFGPAPDQPIV